MENQEKNGGPNYLSAWREHRGLSQSDLAAMLDPPTIQAQIAHLESGERGLTAKWLRKIAKALNVSPGMILDTDPKNFDADIVDMWSRADLKSKQQITQIAKMLVGGRNND